MAKSIITLEKYLELLFESAEHHADKVNLIIYPIIGWVQRFSDDGSIQVLPQDGEFKGVLWFSVQGRRYAFNYNHSTRKIELRQDSAKGKIIYSFDNDTTLEQGTKVFAKL